jgi:hypothetical protein
MKTYERVFARLEKLHAWYGDMGEYCEPGYSTEKESILFGDWNPVPKGLLSALEERFELEWNDEWTSCEECGRYFRTSGDCYQWTMYAWIDGKSGTCLCGDCVKESPDDYIKECINNPKTCVKAFLDLSSLGFTNLNGTFENGFHAHMNDDPVKILAEYKKKYPTYDLVFGNLSVSQFYIDFEIWGKEREEI